MTDYIQTLLNICFTIVTGIIIVGGIGTMAFLALMFWNMVQDNID